MSAIEIATRWGWRWSTIGRISAGLLCLGFALGLGLAVWFELPQDWARSERQRLLAREAVARAVLPLIERGDRAALQSMLDRLIEDDVSLQGVWVQRSDGVMFAYARAAPKTSASTGASELHRSVLALQAGNTQWGTIEFADLSAAHVGLDSRSLQWIGAALAFALLVFAAFYLYLNRALAHLDPTAVIPERVRLAFDLLTQGVLFLDVGGRVLLANAAFRNTFAEGQESITGRKAASFQWLSSQEDQSPIWVRAMRNLQTIRDESRRIVKDGGEELHVVISAAPVQDGGGKVRGCLLTFDNVTQLHRVNSQLNQTLLELEESRAQIVEQNAKLQELASRDPLTGCLNRRAFYEACGPLFALMKRQGKAISCVMFDIDHFKSINDKHGHAVGDQVIRSFALIAKGRMRSSDLLCRYGGEEFCLILPQTTAEDALSIASLLRASIERECGSNCSNVPELRVTASFGVAATSHGTYELEVLMSMADEALYAAKRGGRNRVEMYRPNAALNHQ